MIPYVKILKLEIRPKTQKQKTPNPPPLPCNATPENSKKYSSSLFLLDGCSCNRRLGGLGWWSRNSMVGRIIRNRKGPGTNSEVAQTANDIGSACALTLIVDEFLSNRKLRLVVVFIKVKWSVIDIVFGNTVAKSTDDCDGIKDISVLSSIKQIAQGIEMVVDVFDGI